MASKKHRPLDDPPAVSSSEEEEEEEEEVEEEEEQLPASKQGESELEEQSDEEEEEEVEEESEDEEEKKKTNHVPAQISAGNKKNPQPQSSSEMEDGDESEPESDSVAGVSDFAIKPIVPKSVQESGTPVSKPTTGAGNGKTPAKRPAPKSVEDEKGSKPKKVKASNNVEEEPVVSEKKSAITRLWSEEDEIAVLKGMIEFQSKKGQDPSSNQNEFHEFMKRSLHVDVSKTQLMDKVRRLKKKYKNNAEKSTNGEDPVLSKPHEYKSFQLSKKIWGPLSDKNLVPVDDNVNNGSNHNNHAKSNGTRSARKSSSDKIKISPVVNPIDIKTNEEDMVKGKPEKSESNRETDDFAKLYPFLMNSFRPNSVSNDFGLDVVKNNLSLVGSSVLKEFDNKWKKLNIAETEVCLQRIDLIREQTSMVLDAMKSSKS